jgi:hypothetical protein
MKERSREPDEQESRAAVAVTVAWMLACTSTAVGMFVVLAFRFLMIAFPVAAGRDHPLGRVAGVLLFVAVMTGVVCLALAPLVYRVRGTPPPQAITIGAVLIGFSPIVMLIVLAIL